MSLSVQNQSTTSYRTSFDGGGRSPQGLDAAAERASGAIAAFMHQNGMDKIDANGLYALAQNKGGNVPEEVQQAAKFMLANPDVFQKIETHDVAGTDGLSSVRNFEQSAMGNIPVGGAGSSSGASSRHGAAGNDEAPSFDDAAQSAAGALGAYMHDQGIDSVDPNKLYELATNKNGDVPEEVSKAARFMLQNPDAYQKIETTDVAGADGKSGAGNFDKAAQGLTSFDSPGQTQGTAPFDGASGAPSDSGLDPELQALLDALQKYLESTGLDDGQGSGGQAHQGGRAGRSGGAGGAGGASDAQIQSAAGTLAAYMHDKGIGSVTPDKLYELAANKDGSVPKEVSDAARTMLQNPQAYEKIETTDVAGADGKSGVGNFEKAAQGLTAFGQRSAAGGSQRGGGADDATGGADAGGDARSAAGALAAYMHANGKGSLDVNQLYELANNKDGKVPEEVQKAARYMLQHPETFEKIETADVKGADGKSGVGNFDKAAQGLVEA